VPEDPFPKKGVTQWWGQLKQFYDQHSQPSNL